MDIFILADRLKSNISQSSDMIKNGSLVIANIQAFNISFSKAELCFSGKALDRPRVNSKIVFPTALSNLPTHLIFDQGEQVVWSTYGFNLCYKLLLQKIVSRPALNLSTGPEMLLERHRVSDRSQLRRL